MTRLRCNMMTVKSRKILGTEVPRIVRKPAELLQSHYEVPRIVRKPAKLLQSHYEEHWDQQGEDEVSRMSLGTRWIAVNYL